MAGFDAGVARPQGDTDDVAQYASGLVHKQDWMINGRRVDDGPKSSLATRA